MNAVLDELIRQSEHAIKERSEDWLLASPDVMDKAYPYLFPSLLILLHHKVENQERAAASLQLIDDFDFNGEWARQPSELIDHCKNLSPNQYPEVVNHAYEFIMGRHEQKVLEQLSNIGDLKTKQLQKLLPVMSTLLLSALGAWVEEEQADEKDFKAFMDRQYEEASRETPSKILENLKVEDATQQKKEKEEDFMVHTYTIPSFKPLMIWVPIIFILLFLLLWIKDPNFKISSLWNDAEEEIEAELETSTEKSIWRLPDGQYIHLKHADPFTDVLEHTIGKGPDSISHFYLRHLPLKDSIFPPYYKDVMKHILQLHTALPEQEFHLTVFIRFLPDHELSTSEVEGFIKQIETGLQPLLEDGRLTYKVNLTPTDLWSPDFPTGSGSREMHWQLRLTS